MCGDAGTTKRDPWEKFSWASLPEQYRRNWMILGFSDKNWDAPDRYGSPVFGLRQCQACLGHFRGVDGQQGD